MSQPTANKLISNIKIAAIGLILAAIFLDMTKLSSALSPIFTGIIIAIIVNMPMSAIEKRIYKKCVKIKEKYKPIIHLACLAISWLFIIALLILLCSVILPEIIFCLTAALKKLPSSIIYINKLIQEIGIPINTPIISAISEKAADIITSFTSQLSSIIDRALSAGTGAVISIYILANKDSLKHKADILLKAYLPNKRRYILNSAYMLYSSLSKYLCGMAIESLIVGLIYIITLTWFNIPSALPISILCALLSFIPYIGPIISCTGGFLFILSYDIRLAVYFLIIFVIVQIIEGHFIYPRVIGKKIGLSPMWTLISAIFGARLGGFFGAILAVPCFYAISKFINLNIKNKLL